MWHHNHRKRSLLARYGTKGIIAVIALTSAVGILQSFSMELPRDPSNIPEPFSRSQEVPPLLRVKKEERNTTSLQVSRSRPKDLTKVSGPLPLTHKSSVPKEQPTELNATTPQRVPNQRPKKQSNAPDFSQNTSSNLAAMPILEDQQSPYPPKSEPRFLWGIASTCGQKEHDRRVSIRDTYVKEFQKTTRPDRICSWKALKQGRVANPNDCQLAYAFFVGANPTGATELVSCNDNCPPMEANSTTIQWHLHNVNQKANSSKYQEVVEDDIIYLNIRENQFAGKMDTWFKYAAQSIRNMDSTHHQFSYIVKADSDTVLYPPEFLEFAETNLPVPAERVYSGLRNNPRLWKAPSETKNGTELTFCEEQERKGKRCNEYIVGQAEILSLDLAEYVTSSQCNRTHLMIPTSEDLSLGEYVWSYPGRQINFVPFDNPHNLWKHTTQSKHPVEFRKLWFRYQLSRRLHNTDPSQPKFAMMDIPHSGSNSLLFQTECWRLAPKYAMPCFEYYGSQRPPSISDHTVSMIWASSLDRDSPTVRHMDYNGTLPTATLWVLRHPVHRMMSYYNKQVASWSKRFLKCFKRTENWLQATLEGFPNSTTGSFQPLCTEEQLQRATESMESYLRHSQRAFGAWTKSLPIYVVRTEHLLEDSRQLDTTLAREDNSQVWADWNTHIWARLNLIHINETGHFPTTSQKQAACCHARNEVRIYRKLIDDAKNLDSDAKRESLKYLALHCGRETLDPSLWDCSHTQTSFQLAPEAVPAMLSSAAQSVGEAFMQAEDRKAEHPAANGMVSVPSADQMQENRQHKQPRFLWGIASTTGMRESSRRDSIRQTYLSHFKNTTNRDRICSWLALAQGKVEHPEDCQLAYVFFVGSNPTGPTELVSCNANCPPLVANSSTVKLHHEEFNLKRNRSNFIAEEEDDVVYLNIRENQFEGKMETWFKFATQSIREAKDPHLKMDYVVKADSDTILYPPEFLHFADIALPVPAERVYAGLRNDPHIFDNLNEDRNFTTLTFCQVRDQQGKPCNQYIVGQAEILSLDLAEYVVSPRCNRTDLVIPTSEDMSLGEYVWSYPGKPIQFVPFDNPHNLWFHARKSKNPANFRKYWFVYQKTSLVQTLDQSKPKFALMDVPHSGSIGIMFEGECWFAKRKVARSCFDSYAGRSQPAVSNYTVGFVWEKSMLGNYTGPHLVDVDGAPPSATLWVLRHPVHRMMSFFSKDVTPENKDFLHCFEGTEKWLQLTMHGFPKTNTTTNEIQCSPVEQRRGVEALDTFLRHSSRAFGVWEGTLPIYVLRSEHLVKDARRLESALTPPLATPQVNGDTWTTWAPHVWDRLNLIHMNETQEFAALDATPLKRAACCQARDEVFLYKNLIDQAVNLNETAKKESLKYLALHCGRQTLDPATWDCSFLETSVN